MKLREHQVTLQGNKVVLRPMTEYDWDIVWRWNYNHNTLYFSGGRNFIEYSPERIQAMYRRISEDAFCFIIDVPASQLTSKQLVDSDTDSKPIGDCWLRKIDIERILVAHPVRRCRCIDLIIGETDFMKSVFSIDIISTLTQFGFEKEGAEIMFGCEIPDYNRQSLRAFQKSGYQIYNKVKQPAGNKSRYVYDVILMKEQYKLKPYSKEQK